MIKKFILSLLASILIFGIYWANRYLPAAPGFVALYACGDAFVSKRGNHTNVINDAQAAHPIFGLTTVNINTTAQTVSAALIGGLYKRVAIYNQNTGCTLALNSTEAEIREKSAPYTFNQTLTGNDFFVTEKTNPDLELALDKAFAEPSATSQRNTRAIIVLKNNHILAERYAEGFNKESPLLGWSMTKSLLNAFTGILVKQNKITLDQSNLLPQWENDERSTITIENLLNMSSGLAFDEIYGPGKDATIMLFNTGDTSSYASNMPLQYKPGTHWSYSSGTTNLLAHILRKQAGLSTEQFYDFMYTQLFNPLGMPSMVVQPDESGDPIASSFGYASARDWAKFGLLYLNNGVWSGQQILPSGWVDFTRKPLTHTDKGQYKAQFWLNAGAENDSSNRHFPTLPTDLYSALGHDGQQVLILPSQKLIIVRLGRTLDNSWNTEIFVNEVLAATKEVL